MASAARLPLCLPRLSYSRRLLPDAWAGDAEHILNDTSESDDDLSDSDNNIGEKDSHEDKPDEESSLSVQQVAELISLMLFGLNTSGKNRFMTEAQKAKRDELNNKYTSAWITENKPTDVPKDLSKLVREVALEVSKRMHMINMGRGA